MSKNSGPKFDLLARIRATVSRWFRKLSRYQAATFEEFQDDNVFQLIITVSKGASNLKPIDTEDDDTMKPKTWQEAFEHLTLIISDGFNNVFNEFDRVYNRIDNLETKFDNRINELENRFDNRINDLEIKFDNRINDLETRFDERFDRLEKRVDKIEDDVKDIRSILKKNNIS